jgi:hypothetical protein
MSKVSRRLFYLLFAVFLLLSSAGIAFFLHSAAPAHAATYPVLFDDDHAETAGNADWIISNSIPNPLSQNANPQSETDWTGGISAWGVTLQKTGRYSLETNNTTLTYGNKSNPLDLSNFRELVLPEPNTLFSSSEKTAILSFVHNGGGLFMIADHDGSDRNNDGYDALHIFNDLMDNNGVGNDVFGIQFDVLNIDNENPNNDLPGASTNPLLHGPFGTATGSIIRNGTTETLNKTDNSSATGVIYRSGYSNTGTTGAFVSSSTYGSGRVAAVGDSSAIDDGTCQSGNTCYDGWDDPSGQDSILFPNTTEWLAGGSTTTATPTSTSASTPTKTTTPNPTPTPAITPTSTSTSVNAISNGGFESGTSPWIESSSGGNELIDTTRPHTGTHSADLCGANSCNDSIYQQVAIPSTATSAQLGYYWYMDTQETTTSPYDYLYVRIRSASGSTLTTVQTITNGSTADTWQSATFTVNVSTYKGQNIQVAFVATTGSRDPSQFFVDDVTLRIS